LTVVVLFVSLLAFALIIRATARTTAQTTALQTDIRNLKQEQETLNEKAQTVKSSLSSEQYSALRAAHALVDRKQFSWSRLLADLETALPGNVRVTRISVRDVASTADRTVAELDIGLVAKSSTTVTDMIAQMDRAGIFQAELRSQNLQTGRGESVTEYELYVLYRPRLGTAAVDTQPADLASLAREKTVGGAR